tara:strand:- start:7934 stop:8446 length:513 start_codon:yes stop_codon:yes gene_type:complete
MSSNRFDLIRQKYNMNTTNTDNSINTTNIDSSSLLTQSVENANIIDQIPGYDKNTTAIFIQQLREELQEQNQINSILKQKNYEQTTQEIEGFIENNSINVSEQLIEIKNLYENLKNVHTQNINLHNEEDEHLEVLQSENVKNVASELRQLKTLKTEITAFLYQNGIRRND